MPHIRPDPPDPSASTDESAPAAAPSRRRVLAGGLAGAAGAVLSGCVGPQRRASLDAAHSPESKDARAFLRAYDREMQRLYTDAQQAAWIAATDVSDAHSAARAAAQKRFDAFVGAAPRMEQISSLRRRAWRLEPLVARQLDRAWSAAAHAPGTVPQLVAQRADAESAQSQTLDGFAFVIRQPGRPDRPVNANDIDDVLMKSRDLSERKAAWDASKEVGGALKPGLLKLRDLRNRVARELDYRSYFELEVSDYGMSVRELMALMRTVLDQTRPLYEQVHCFVKHRLAAGYGQPVPRRIPAHWLPNRWGQEWPGLVESVDLDPLFADKTPEWVVRQAERFYVSMGFPSLPDSFWKRSDLYEAPPGGPRRKNSHASAWHIDLEHDVRSLMSVRADAGWFATCHHELGHIYYCLSYTDAGVPLLLRNGANRAFHEAIGDLIALAGGQRPYLADIGLLRGPAASASAEQWLLAQALDGQVVFMPFACGTMTGFEHDFYETELPADRLNARWWEIVAREQGIDPPAPRGEEHCDAASKTHINDDPAAYYDYAIGRLIVYQVHDYIARTILKADPRSCSYYNRRDVGEYLHALLSLGATRDWRQVLRDFTGEDLSARALVEYYAPLLDFLKRENAGRDTAFA